MLLDLVLGLESLTPEDCINRAPFLSHFGWVSSGGVTDRWVRGEGPAYFLVTSLCLPPKLLTRLHLITTVNPAWKRSLYGPSSTLALVTLVPSGLRPAKFPTSLQGHQPL